MEETFGYLIAGAIGGFVVHIFYYVKQYFTEKEIPKSMNILIYENSYRNLKTKLIFYAPLNGLDCLEPPEWICKKDATYKFVIG